MGKPLSPLTAYKFVADGEIQESELPLKGDVLTVTVQDIAPQSKHFKYVAIGSLTDFSTCAEVDLLRDGRVQAFLPQLLRASAQKCQPKEVVNMAWGEGEHETH